MVLLRCWYPELTEDVDVLEHSVLLIMLIVSAVLGHTAASAPLQNCKNVSEISAHVLRGARSSLDAPCGGTSAGTEVSRRFNDLDGSAPFLLRCYLAAASGLPQIYER